MVDIFLKRTRGGGYSLQWPMYGEAPSKKKTLFRLQVHKRVRIYRLKYTKGYENLSFWSVKRPEGLTNAFYGCEKVKKKRSSFVIYSYSDIGSKQQLKMYTKFQTRYVIGVPFLS